MNYSLFVGAGKWQAAGSESKTQGFFGLDSNAEWQPITKGLPSQVEVRSIVLHPAHQGTIFVGTQKGPYRSEDGGESWHPLLLPADTADEDLVVWSICLDPFDPKTIYVGTQNTSVFRSRDNGYSFERLVIPEPEGAICGSFTMRVIAIAVAAGNPNHIVVAFEIGGLVASQDGGTTWRSCNPELLRLSQQQHLRSAIVSNRESEGMMDSHALVFDPRNPHTLWLANRMGLFRSDDGGQNWSEFGINRFSPLTYARDLQASRLQPDRMYAALSVAAASDEGAVYRSDDRGNSWYRFDRAVDIDSTLMAVAESSTTPDRVYCAARHGKIYGTEDGGASWVSHQLPNGIQGVYAIACV